MKAIDNIKDLEKEIRNNKTRIGVTKEFYYWLQAKIPEIEYRRENHLADIPICFYGGIEIYIEDEELKDSDD